MDLSIIIINWNTRDMLRDCLQSVFETHDELTIEVWVVDNASNDSSVDLVEKEFPQVNLICNAENRGFAAANNQALEKVSGRQILLLNSDTVVHGKVLAKSVAYLDQNASVGAMGCRVLNSDGTLQITCSRSPSILNLFIQTSALNRLPVDFFDRYRMTRWDRLEERRVEVVSGCYLMVRRKALQAVGFLDESFFFYGEETDWCRRLRDAGWDLVFSPVGEITHHGGGSVRQLSHQRNIMLSEGTIRYHRKHNGWLAAVTCWLLLAFFNFSRAISYGLVGILTNRGADTGSVFRKVVASFGAAWPRKT